jgi:2-polyprenyl-6-methoxyphenol hydroxylase-like FAD-dependent oxidoreductase
MGLEDAATLGHLLSKVTSPTQLPKATALYNSLRTARTMKLVEETNIYRSELMDQRLESAQESGMDWKEYAEF